MQNLHQDILFFMFKIQKKNISSDLSFKQPNIGSCFKRVYTTSYEGLSV